MTYLWDTGCSELLVNDTIPGDSLHAVRLGNTEMEVAGSNFTQGASYYMLLPLKKHLSKLFQMAKATALPQVVQPLPLVDISGLMDKVYDEYCNSRLSNSLSIEFTREQCPNQHGGEISGCC
jgi:hypothetical protein